MPRDDWKLVNGVGSGKASPAMPDASKPADTTQPPPKPAAFHDFESRDGCLKMNGKRFNLKGITWCEFDSSKGVLGALEGRPVDDTLDFLAKEGSNALRLLINVELALDLDKKRPNSKGYETMRDLPTGRLLEYLLPEAAKRGILVVLAMSVMPSGQSADTFTKLWYNDQVAECELTQAWLHLVKRLSPHWNFFGVDLCNELHGEASWGSELDVTGKAKTDWRLAAEVLGNVILSKCPRLLIFVQGVEKNCEPHQTAEPCFWGGALCSADKHPVELSVPHRVVYSPHVFGPSVTNQPYFQDDSGYTLNLSGIWDAQFMRAKKTGAAVVIGAWGGKFMHGSADRAWGEALVAYLQENDSADTFFSKMEHQGGQVEGLLKADRRTPNPYKLDLLRRLCPHPTPVKTPAGAIKP